MDQDEQQQDAEARPARRVNWWVLAIPGAIAACILGAFIKDQVAPDQHPADKPWTCSRWTDERDDVRHSWAGGRLLALRQHDGLGVPTDAQVDAFAGRVTAACESGHTDDLNAAAEAAYITG